MKDKNFGRGSASRRRAERWAEKHGGIVTEDRSGRTYVTTPTPMSEMPEPTPLNPKPEIVSEVYFDLEATEPEEEPEETEEETE